MVAPEPVQFSHMNLLAVYSDDLAFGLGITDTNLPREQFRAALRFNDLELAHADSADVSEAIRSHLRYGDRTPWLSEN